MDNHDDHEEILSPSSSSSSSATKGTRNGKGKEKEKERERSGLDGKSNNSNSNSNTDIKGKGREVYLDIDENEDSRAKSKASTSSNHLGGSSSRAKTTRQPKKGKGNVSNGSTVHDDQNDDSKRSRSSKTTTVPLISQPSNLNNPLPNSQTQQTQAIALVNTILSESDLYKVLGCDKKSKTEEIRRKYIQRCRVCHPDKLPTYPPSTSAFQKLSYAYETLSNPSTRQTYDLLGSTNGYPIDNDNNSYFDDTTTTGGGGGFGFGFGFGFGGYGNMFSGGGDNGMGSNSAGAGSGFEAGAMGNEGGYYYTRGEETLNGVLWQIFGEFMEGEFEMVRVAIVALNESNPGLNLGEESIENLENAFRKVREMALVGQKYLRLIKFELIRLYEIQHSLRQLSYFNVTGRMRLTIKMARVGLSIPMAIDRAMKEDSSDSEDDSEDEEDHSSSSDNGTTPRGLNSQTGRGRTRKRKRRKGKGGGGRPPRTGLLGKRTAGLLTMAVGVLERGEQII